MLRCPRLSQKTRPILLVDHRHKEVGIEEQQCPVELGRRDAQDGVRMLVHLDDAAHHAAIVLKMTVPIGVGQHQVRCAVRAMLVGDVEEAAEIWLNLHRIEVVPSHLVAPDLGWILARVERHLGEDIGRQTVEAAVAIAQIEIVGIRGSLFLVAAALDRVEALRIRHIQRAQDQRIQYAKHHGICADRERQGQDGGNRESGRAAEIAHRNAHIGPDGFQRRPLPDLAAALFQQRFGCQRRGAPAAQPPARLMPSPINCSARSSRCSRISSERSS